MDRFLVLGMIVLVSKKMRKAFALFCSLEVLTSVSSRYSKSCEKCSQNLISYERAKQESFSLLASWSRLSCGIFKFCVGTFGFLASNDFADWVNLKEDEDKKQTLKNWWKVGSVLVGADGFRDIMDVLYLAEEREDFELLKEIYDKNYKNKSNVILRHFKENDICMTYNAVRLLEALVKFRAYWEAYCESAKQNVLKILTSSTNLSKLEDEKTITAASIIEILDKSEGLP